METKESTGVLNDLILINNDRIEGYQKAKAELNDGNEDLKALFTDMISESHTLKMALATEVAASGEDIEEGTTNSGKIYRAWMDVKAHVHSLISQQKATLRASHDKIQALRDAQA